MPRKKMVVDASNETMSFKQEKLSVKILKAIKTLGTSTVEVRHSLERLKITGEPFSDRNCPISNFVKSKFNLNGYYLSTQSGEIYLYNHFGGDIIDKVILPPVIVKFLHKFDSGKYRRLVKCGK